MSWSWSAEEDAAMDYLPHAAQVLYMRVLRRRMDYSTGIVGISCRVSYQQIGEWLEVRPPPKSTKPVVRLSVGEIRAALAQLERAGLIVRVERSGEVMPLVFSLPLAKTGLIREKYERQDERQQKPLSATAISTDDKNLIDSLFNPLNSSVCDANSTVDNSKNNSLKIAMNDSKNQDEQQDEQQTSGSLVSLSLNNNITLRARGNGYLIADDWLPSVAIVEKIVAEFSLSPLFIRQKSIEMRMLWREQGSIAVNWDFYFYGAVKNKIEQADGEFLTAQLINAARGGNEQY